MRRLISSLLVVVLMAVGLGIAPGTSPDASAYCGNHMGIDYTEYYYNYGFRGSEDPYPYATQCNENDWYATRAYDMNSNDGGCIDVQIGHASQQFQTVSSSCGGGPYWTWRWNGGSPSTWFIRLCWNGTCKPAQLLTVA